MTVTVKLNDFPFFAALLYAFSHHCCQLSRKDSRTGVLFKYQDSCLVLAIPQAAMNRTGPVINNLKVHIVLTEEGTKSLGISLLRKEKKSINNFHVVRDGTFTYIIFPKGFVNITGIRCVNSLERVIPQFCLSFELKKSDIASEVIIDNISASGNFGRRVDLEALQRTVNCGKRGTKTFSIHVDRNFFPGAFCKTRRTDVKGIGTITLFSSGFFVIVGSSCVQHVETVYQQMAVIMQTL